MKFTVQQSIFLKALNHCASIAERRTTVPILSHVVLDASQDGQLKLMATDLELSVIESVPVQTAVTGVTTVSVHLIREIVRKFSDKTEIDLYLDSASQQLFIENASARFQLATLPVEDYPSLQNTEFTSTFSIGKKVLLDLMDGTGFAMSTEETRYYLNGIYFHATSENSLRAVATDGHRMAWVQTILPQGAANIPGIIISRKTVNQVTSMLEGLKDEEEVEISLSETLVQFKCHNFVLISRLVDGTFPDYERVIPSDNTKSMLVAMPEFYSAVDRVSTVATDKNKWVKLWLDAGKLRLTVDGNELGSAHEEMPVDYQSEPLSIGFNARYLLDVANRMQEKEAEILFSDEATPIIIREFQNPNALYVVMPMRV